MHACGGRPMRGLGQPSLLHRCSLQSSLPKACLHGRLETAKFSEHPIMQQEFRVIPKYFLVTDFTLDDSIHVLDV